MTSCSLQASENIDGGCLAAPTFTCRAGVHEFEHDSLALLSLQGMLANWSAQRLTSQPSTSPCWSGHQAQSDRLGAAASGGATSTCAAGAAADSRLAGCLCMRLPASCSRLPTTALPCSVTVVLPLPPSLLLLPPVVTSSVAFAGPLSVSNIACRNTASSARVEAESKPARQATTQSLLCNVSSSMLCPSHARGEVNGTPPAWTAIE